MALRRTPGIRQVPNASTPRFPILGCGLFTGAVSLRLVTRDNSGEMGGRIASPTLIGRIEELQTLEAARVRAANGEPAVVLVGGEAGVGKTRLVAELTARCAADGARGGVSGPGCCPPWASPTPAHPARPPRRGCSSYCSVYSPD